MSKNKKTQSSLGKTLMNHKRKEDISKVYLSFFLKNSVTLPMYLLLLKKNSDQSSTSLLLKNSLWKPNSLPKISRYSKPMELNFAGLERNKNPGGT